MQNSGDRIIQHLRTVAFERASRSANPELARRVDAIKHFQHARFEQSYAKLLADPRYGRAARFFLDDLYGPRDFADRDRQFERVVPALVRLFSRDIVTTVCELAELHALSEGLDSTMARQLDGLPLKWPSYTRAWQATGAAPSRYRQITLLQDIGLALDRYTRKPLLRHSLSLMRKPARLAGIGDLQAFLEKGFDTFAAMRGATTFLNVIVEHETVLAQRLFGIDVRTMPDAYPGELP